VLVNGKILLFICEVNIMDEKKVKIVLGQNIKNLRTHRQYSQAELAEMADISIISLRNI